MAKWAEWLAPGCVAVSPFPVMTMISRFTFYDVIKNEALDFNPRDMVM